MTDLIFFLVAIVLIAVLGFVAFEILSAIGAWILNVIDLSN